jgi:hypothetical protein
MAGRRIRAYQNGASIRPLTKHLRQDVTHKPRHPFQVRLVPEAAHEKHGVRLTHHVRVCCVARSIYAGATLVIELVRERR